ncbi:MAG: hypothetical protein WCC74_00465 [Minisyncoccia bacterium]
MWITWSVVGLVVGCLCWLIIWSKTRQWFVKGPWGLFIKPIAKDAGEKIKQRVTKFLEKRKVKIGMKSLAKGSSRKWLFIGLGILVTIFEGLWLLARRTIMSLGHTTTTENGIGWNLLWIIPLLIFAGIIVVLFVRMFGSPASSGSGKFLWCKVVACWAFIKSVFPHIFWGLVIIWIVLKMFSCAGSEPKVQVPQKDISTEGMQGRFHWNQSPEGIIGSGRVLDKGSCNALVQVDNSNIWQIVLSDNQGRIDHLLWKKNEPFGKWERKYPPDHGEWQLEKISHNEYRGWTTTTTYPGQRMQAKLTLR